MTPMEDMAAELRALTEHVAAMHAQLAKRDFIMPRETRARLERANALLAAIPATADPDWVGEADALCTLLRSEVPS